MVITRSKAANMSQESTKLKDHAQSFFIEEEASKTQLHMEEVMRVCMRTLQIVATSQANTQQVTRRPPKFAGRPEESADDIKN